MNRWVRLAGALALAIARPGADGVIAGETVAKAPADGYTFLFTGATTLNFAPVARKSISYDAINDFTPVGRIGSFGFFLYVNDALPVKSMGELVAYAKANPGKLNYGTSNATSVVATAQLTQSARLQMTHIPYKGDPQLITDLLAGRVQLSIAAGAALPHVKDGKLRVLASLSPARNPLLPEVPTLAEAGIHGVSVTPWAGLFGPAKLPRDIVERVSRELAKALARDDVREQLGKQAFDAASSTPEELGTLVKEQLGVWRKAIQAAGIEPE